MHLLQRTVMKTFSAFLLSSLLLLPAGAQTSQHASTGGVHWYVAPIAHISGVNGKAALFEGFEAGWIINDHLTLGIEGSQLETDVDADRPGPEGSPYIHMFYSGLTVEYGIYPAPRLRLAGRALLGGAEAHWRETSDDWMFGNREKDEEHTTSIVVEPGFRASYALTKWLQVMAGASYRYVGAGKSHAIEQADMRNFAGTLGVRLGRF